jgi:DnaJ family protein C protein 22
MSDTKSIKFAYFFALTGGLFGLHHFYLGRTQHALLWLTTFGGFGIGIFYELLFKLKQYVREINHDNLIINQYEKKIRELKSPAFEIQRFFGQYIISVFYGFTTYYAFPDTWLEKNSSSLFIAFCTAFAIAIGTQLAGTIGPRQCSFIWPLLGAIFGIPFLIVNRDTSPSFNIVAFLSSWIFEWKIEWNSEYFSKKSEKKKKIRFMKRCLIYGCGAIIFGIILTSAIYQNLQVDIHGNGERVKVKDILTDFFESQEFQRIYYQLSNVGRQLYGFYLRQGFKGIWNEIWKALNKERDKQAYEVKEKKSFDIQYLNYLGFESYT